MPQKTLNHKLSAPQYRIFRDRSRFRVLNAGRRFGKTYLAVVELVTGAVLNPWSNGWYVAPTYRAAKRIAWPELKAFIPREYIQSKDETELTINLINGALIALHGADNPDSLRGPGLDRVILDEAAYIKQTAWTQVIRPMLSDRLGWALFISTPAGYNWFYDLYIVAGERDNWNRYEYTTLDGGRVEASEIEEARSELDDKSFKQEYLASFEALTGRVYYAYHRDYNVAEVSDSLELPLLIGMDFNVDPMSAVLAVKKAQYLHVFDEIEIPNGSTEEMAKEIRRRFPDRKIYVYPDPTGNARKTSAPVGQTDFTILKQAGMIVRSPRGSYNVSDKINLTNGALCNAAGVRRAILASGHRLRSLKKGLDGLTFKEGTSAPDKGLGLDHITDAFAYMACWEFPLKSKIQRVTVTGV